MLDTPALLLNPGLLFGFVRNQNPVGMIQVSLFIHFTSGEEIIHNKQFSVHIKIHVC